MKNIHKNLLTAIACTLFLALASCATYVSNPAYSNDSAIADRSFEVVGDITPVRLDRQMLDRGISNVLLENARAQYGEDVDAVIDIRSITLAGNTLLFIFPLPGRTVYEATAIRYTN